MLSTSLSVVNLKSVSSTPEKSLERLDNMITCGPLIMRVSSSVVVK